MNLAARGLLRIGGRVLIADAGIALGLGLLGWLLGWSTRETWGAAFVWAGILAAAVGGFAVSGAWFGRMTHLSYAASAGQPSLEQRTRLAMRDVDAGYARILILLAVALPLVAVGLWLDPRA